MGEVIQLQGDQRKDVQEFLVAKDGLELDAKTIKVCHKRVLPTTQLLTHIRSTVSRHCYLCPTCLAQPWRTNSAVHPKQHDHLRDRPEAVPLTTTIDGSAVQLTWDTAGTAFAYFGSN